MQNVFDKLYEKSRKHEELLNLMPMVLVRENILLAYRNIKANSGSNTPGSDGKTIRDIAKLSPDEVVNTVRYIITESKHGYRPKPVRRKDIPKPYDPSKTRPLGIPCIWDRLVQQCIKQIMEPICEAKFSENSYGFRPGRSAEHAVSRIYNLIQLSHLNYVIEFDIRGFFDNVDHSKLIRQIWTMGIHDKHLIYVIKQILKAPIKMPSGELTYPQKGTPQGGIISPLLANIVLNELDQWIDSQWTENPVTRKYAIGTNKSGSEVRSSGYRAMRNTRLKEMFIVRYADDFRILCRTKNDAQKVKIAVEKWLNERLKLEVSPEKTRIVNVKRRYSEFLGFKIRLIPRKHKQVIESHISDKQLDRQRQSLVKQARNIANPRHGRTELEEVKLYNSMVVGMQNYYCIATKISADCRLLNRAVMTTLTNRLGTGPKHRLRKSGRPLSNEEKKKYGVSAMLRYVAESKEPIYPVSFTQHKHPMSRKRKSCNYTAEGRQGTHDNLRINTALMLKLMRQPIYGRSVEYADNRISLYSAQWGKCAVTGIEFSTADEIHCHHKVPKSNGGDDSFKNMVLILETVHKLLHATRKETIDKYMNILQLNKQQLKKLNALRGNAGLSELPV